MLYQFWFCWKKMIVIKNLGFNQYFQQESNWAPQVGLTFWTEFCYRKTFLSCSNQVGKIVLVADHFNEIAEKQSIWKPAAILTEIGGIFFYFHKKFIFSFLKYWMWYNSNSTSLWNMKLSHLSNKIHTGWFRQALKLTLSRSLVVVLGGLQSTLCLTHRSSKNCRVSDKKKPKLPHFKYEWTIKPHPILPNPYQSKHWILVLIPILLPW